MVNMPLERLQDAPDLSPLPPPVEVFAPDALTTLVEPVAEPSPVDLAHELPETTVITHAPGWTIFRNLYMSGGTLFVVTSNSSSTFPHPRFMTSTGLAADSTAENARSREPTSADLDFLTPEEAKRRWGGDVAGGQRNRVWTVEGNTVSASCLAPDQRV